jgi:Domain of unknown function (DUF5602)
MPTRRLLRGAALTLAGCTALAFLPGCSGESAQTHSTSSTSNSASTSTGGTFFGPSQSLGDGTAKTYVTFNDGGQPTEVGLRLTATALEGLPQSGSMLMLPFPDQAAATAFDHVMLNWNPHGHEPRELFGKPHFDFHFDMVPMATMHGITPNDPDYAAKADHLPETKYLPQDYAVPPGPPAAAQAVPGMGVHLVDSSDTSLVPGAYDFKQIVLAGSWDGQVAFTEPMITRAWLKSGPSFEHALKQPQAYQKSAYYPTAYAVHVDQPTKDYVISLTDLTMRSAS